MCTARAAQANQTVAATCSGAEGGIKDGHMRARGMPEPREWSRGQGTRGYYSVTIVPKKVDPVIFLARKTFSKSIRTKSKMVANQRHFLLRKIEPIQHWNEVLQFIRETGRRNVLLPTAKLTAIRIPDKRLSVPQ